jgi:hypothetical protein
LKLSHFFTQSPRDELTLDIRQSGPEQTAIAGDVVAMGTQAGEVLVDHGHHS